MRNKIRIKKPEYLTFGHILPSFITLCSAACGMTAILWASRGVFTGAVVLVILGAVLDMMDGRVARKFGTTSQFGVEMDSLADALSFGVAPAFVMFFYAGSQVRGLGWAVSIIFAAACILRLARFNATTGKQADYWTYYFMGVPAPAGGILGMLPIALYQATGLEIFTNPWLVIGNLFIVAMLFVSSIPTLSLKKLHISKEWMLVILMLLIVILTAAFLYFWEVLSFIWVAYLVTIPFTVFGFIKRRRGHNETRA